MLATCGWSAVLGRGDKEGQKDILTPATGLMDDVLDLTVEGRTLTCLIEDGSGDLSRGFLYRNQRLLLVGVTSSGLGCQERLLLSREVLVSTERSFKTQLTWSWDARKDSLDDIHDDAITDL